MNEFEKEKEELCMEAILKEIGEFGRFQKILVSTLIMLFLPTTFLVLMMYFSTISPSWKCVANSTSCPFTGNQHPDNDYRCNIPRTDWFYTKPNTFSIVTQFGIDCESQWLLNLLSSMIFVGWAFGSVILGWIGDRYGRKAVLAPAFCTLIVAGFICPFLPNIYLIMACQCVVGFCIPGVQLQTFILLSEFVGSKQRPFACFLLVVSNPVGFCLLAFKAYMIENWKILSIVCTVPYIVGIFFIKFIPESIKWMHCYGQTDKVKKLVKRIAIWNKKEITENFTVASPSIIVNKANPIDLFRTRPLATKSLIQGYLWFAIVTCYYGLHLAANDFGGTIYRDFAILNLCEAPGLALAAVVCMKFGRKRSTLIPLMFGSLSCFTIAILQTKEHMKTARVVLGIIGNFAQAMSFFGVYQWSVEIFPVRIRNQGMGFLQVVSHGGSVCVPWIVKGLREFGKWCPFVVLGVSTLVACLTGMWLPETDERKKVDVCKKGDKDKAGRNVTDSNV